MLNGYGLDSGFSKGHQRGTTLLPPLSRSVAFILSDVIEDWAIWNSCLRVVKFIDHDFG